MIRYTTFEQSMKLNERGIDTKLGAKHYIQTKVDSSSGTSFADQAMMELNKDVLPKQLLCAAFTLEQLMHAVAPFVGNHGFPAQVRSHVGRRDGEKNPIRILQYLFSYNGVSFVIDGDYPIEVMCNLLFKLIDVYGIKSDYINKALYNFNNAA